MVFSSCLTPSFYARRFFGKFSWLQAISAEFRRVNDSSIQAVKNVSLSRVHFPLKRRKKPCFGLKIGFFGAFCLPSGSQAHFLILSVRILVLFALHAVLSGCARRSSCTFQGEGVISFAAFNFEWAETGHGMDCVRMQLNFRQRGIVDCFLDR
jgi:hypothetical protein